MADTTSVDMTAVGEERPGWSGLWPLDPGIAFLNHGSYGACPREILDLQAALRAELESEPVRFLGRHLRVRPSIGSSTRP